METEKYDANEMLKQMAAEAVKQQAHVRAAVRDLTLSALEAREFGISQIKNVVHKISEGVSNGLSEKANVGNLISDAVAGMDDALLKVVEANKLALSKLGDSSSFDDSTVAKVLRELESLEEQFRDGLKKGTETARRSKSSGRLFLTKFRKTRRKLVNRCYRHWQSTQNRLTVQLNRRGKRG